MPRGEVGQNCIDFVGRRTLSVESSGKSLWHLDSIGSRSLREKAKVQIKLLNGRTNAVRIWDGVKRD